MDACRSLSRLYVLCSHKLDPVYSCVQGAHAVAEYHLDNGDQEWKNEYLIFLKADVRRWKKKLERMGLKFTEFYEPDLDNQLTAIALVDSGTIFRNLKLVKS